MTRTLSERRAMCFRSWDQYCQNKVVENFKLFGESSSWFCFQKFSPKSFAQPRQENPVCPSILPLAGEEVMDTCMESQVVSILNKIAPRLRAVEYTNSTFAEGLDPPQCVSRIWHKTISSFVSLRNVEFLFIAIVPRSTLARSGNTWLGLICGSNRNDWHLNWVKQMTYAKWNS